jgi:hypothetical protein
MRIEEGSTESLRNRDRKTVATLRIPCPSLGGARPMPLEAAMPRAPSLHRGGRHRAHRPRRERDDAPARGTRRGSTDGMAPRRHLTAFTGRARASGYNSSQLQKTWRGRTRWRAPRRPRQAGLPPEGLQGGQPPGSERGQGRRPRAEEDSRLAGVPARRTCVAEIGSAVAKLRETGETSLPPTRGNDRSPAGGS